MCVVFLAQKHLKKMSFTIVASKDEYTTSTYSNIDVAFFWFPIEKYFFCNIDLAETRLISNGFSHGCSTCFRVGLPRRK
jgi:hypothetical protein